MAATVETVTVDLDVTVSSPATFFGFADSKKGEGSKKSVKSFSVTGKVAGADGEEQDFEVKDCSYIVGGTKYASRKAIKKAIGDLTFSGCSMTIEVGHRPWGYGGGGGGGGGG
eukprot:CAMPEP_0119472648 /NCGR_PEP_ID=MMETSP1344-20130328/4619_1 /TAXON_ID=236787 /ORGANISM="Florenciella parvula, Strain CCMP2471" /LENGTH=112 /DNA_ID=CAMNT_0007505621 /DNA_START=152 /DNA_END=486 /DNA_ORIENTATION=-